jgi:hypothetical protein
MTNQLNLAIMIQDTPTFALGPGLILTVVVRELPLTSFFGLRGRLIVMLELHLRPLGFLLMLSAGGGAERS